MAAGHGPLLHRRCRTKIRDAQLGPEELFARLAGNLNRAAPTKFARFQRALAATDDPVHGQPARQVEHSD